MKLKLSFLLSFCIFCSIATNSNAQNSREYITSDGVIHVSMSQKFDETYTKSAIDIGSTLIEGNLYSRTYYWGEDAPKFGARYKVLPVYPENQKVIIFPYTPYLDEYMKLSRKYTSKNDGKTYQIDVDPRLYKYSIYSMTGKNGFFQFHKMKPGKYFIYAERTLSGSVNKSYDTGERSIHQDPYQGTTITKHMELRPVKWQTLATFEQFIEIKEGENLKKIDARLMINR